MTKQEKIAFVIGYYQGKTPNMDKDELSRLVAQWGLKNIDILNAFPTFQKAAEDSGMFE